MSGSRYISSIKREQVWGSYWGCWVARRCGSTRTGSSSAGSRGIVAPRRRSRRRGSAQAAGRGTPWARIPGWCPPHQSRRRPREARRDARTSRPARAEEAGMPGSSRRPPAGLAGPGVARCRCRGGGGGRRRSPGTAGGRAPRSSAGWGSGPGGAWPGSGAGTWRGPCPAAGNLRTSFQVRGLPQHTADPACLSHLVCR